MRIEENTKYVKDKYLLKRSKEFNLEKIFENTICNAV